MCMNEQILQEQREHYQLARIESRAIANVVAGMRFKENSVGKAVR